MVYLCLLIACLALPEAYRLVNKRNVALHLPDKTAAFLKRYHIIMAICMVLLIGLRSVNIGIDTLNYAYMYINAASTPFSYLNEDIKDKGYVFLCIVLNRLGVNFTEFNILYAIFNISIITYMIYKYSDMPWMSFFLFMAFGFFTLQFTMVRQSLAISIVLLAIILDKNKGIWDFVKFVLLVWIAYTIHASAVVALPIWFIRKIKPDKIWTFIFIAIIVFCYLFKGAIGELMFNLAGDVSESYENYGDELIENAGMFLYLMILVSVIFSIIIPQFLDNKWNFMTFIFLCIMLMMLPALQGGGAIMRIYYYYYIFMIVHIPNMISSVNRSKDRFITLLIMLLFLSVGLYMFANDVFVNDTYKINPYEFFWQGE